MKTTKITGQLGEKLAQDFLKGRGYAIVTTNYRTRDGEVDIIASKDGVLVFVEGAGQEQPRLRHAGRIRHSPQEAKAGAGGATIRADP